ncbi:hypothetical protein ECANGB1_1713 [Enterospora canceri]|uniref:Signal peptidase complex subunit 3 n=1 Tax=Enterospora canceri TaxID=1081671 RepID=A0A1Y1S985_9MICR|nr:hypothetical protein ECANGB1_1713 [Enterospora canceri]
MKNISIRVSTFFSYLFQSTTTMCILLFLATLVLKKDQIKANPTITTFGHKANNCYMRFSPNIDLTKEFNMNTKQVFLYVVCVTGSKHEMVWSKIVEESSRKKLYDLVRNSYRFRIRGDISAYDAIYFELRGSVFPKIGKMEDKLYARFAYKKKVVY